MQFLRDKNILYLANDKSQKIICKNERAAKTAEKILWKKTKEFYKMRRALKSLEKCSHNTYEMINEQLDEAKENAKIQHKSLETKATELARQNTKRA